MWKWGAHVRRQNAGKNFLGVVPLHLFGSISTISRFGECFRDGQYSLVCCFSTRGAPPCVAICKSGGHVPPVPYGVVADENRYLFQCFICHIICHMSEPLDSSAIMPSTQTIVDRVFILVWRLHDGRFVVLYDVCVMGPLKLWPYGAIQICLLLLLLYVGPRSPRSRNPALVMMLAGYHSSGFR